MCTTASTKLLKLNKNTKKLQVDILCGFFGSRSKRPRVLQLLIKMLIR